MTTRRPLIQRTIEQLEALFEQQRDDPQALSILVDELGNRKTRRAQKLKQRAMAAARKARATSAGHAGKPSGPGCDVADPAPEPSPRTTAGGSTTPLRPTRRSDSPLAPPERQRPELRPAPPPASMTNEPENVLSAWTAMEVLSPPSFRRPEDLAGGDRSKIVIFDDRPLPWEGGGEKSRRNYRLYYQVVLGTIDMECAMAALLDVYADRREERPQARGEAVLATIMVDREGRPTEGDPVGIASFGWAVPVALKGDLRELGKWPQVERGLVERLVEQVVRQDDHGNPQPLGAADIAAAHEWLVGALGLEPWLVRPPRLMVRTYQYFRIKEPPETIILNSFYLDDLARASKQARSGALPANLRRYLGVVKPGTRRNLMTDTRALASALEPAKYPIGSWPAHGRHSLMFLQQCAVNLASHDLVDGGILAVNGPPGTGKTTLLKDIVAGVVTERAKAMCAFDDPEAAFESTGQKLRRGNAFLTIYRPAKALKGHEIVVASSNNKAVENVSAELPDLAAIADDASDLRYFKTIADGLRDRESWGLVAAVLGNRKNIAEFRKIIWWDEERGLHRYLRQCCGMPQMIEGQDEDGARQRLPLVIERENPPKDHKAAVRCWRDARTDFRAALAKAERALGALQKAHELLEAMRARREVLEKLDRDIPAALADLRAAEDARSVAEADCADRLEKAGQAQGAVDASLRERPGFWRRLFRMAGYRRWREIHADLVRRLEEESAALGEAQSILEARRSRHALAGRTVHDLKNRKETEASLLAREQKDYDAVAGTIHGRIVSDEFFDLPHRDQQLAVPWLDEAVARLRHEVFVKAMAVHRAFVDAAARPLRHNLGILMDDFGSRSLGDAKRDKLIPELWATLFLVVPVVSTTFASVSRMFGRVGPEAFGWLLIDEAGQALPQAAVGALMRTRKAMVVGDPIQIEPVVVLPETLTAAMCGQFGVDPSLYNAPGASAQTLADGATAYLGTFESRDGTREVGVPLLVHRRCADPMFRISNAVAYENLMVQAKVAKPSPILQALGQSCWIDTRGRGTDKWCPEEGEAVIELLERLRSRGVDPDLYIVTPFVVVQDRMRALLRSRGVMDGWVDDPWAWTWERIGTVHTVQGREAEAVIFVLGAPERDQQGARAWAGSRPNLLNVAITRAREALYVVGNRELWQGAGVFHALHGMMPR